MYRIVWLSLLLLSFARAQVDIFEFAAAGLDQSVRLQLEADISPDIRQHPDADTALILAAKNNQVNVVRQLIEAGADLNLYNNYGYTALMTAAEAGYLETVNALVQVGADLNLTRKYHGENALMLAAQQGHTEIVTRLLATGQTERKTDALRCAVRESHDEVVEVLLQAGVATDEEGVFDNVCSFGYPDQALHIAVNNHDLVLVKRLLAAGANPNAGSFRRYGVYYTPLMIAATQDKQGDILEQLLAAGADIHQATSGMDALTLAAETGNVLTVQLLLGAGAEPTGKLAAAAQSGDLVIFDLIYKAIPEVSQKELDAALLSASRAKHPNVVEHLLSLGAKTYPYSDGEFAYLNPFYSLAYVEEVLAARAFEVAWLLVDAGVKIPNDYFTDENGAKLASQQYILAPIIARETLRDGLTREIFFKARAAQLDADVRDVDYQSTLFYATEYGDVTHLAKLLEQGADPNARSQRRYHALDTPLCIAAAYQGFDSWFSDGLKADKPDRQTALDMVKILLKAGSNVNQPNGAGLLSLGIASAFADNTMIELLIEHGADINAQDSFGYSALMIASRLNHESTARLLLSRGADATVLDKQGRNVFMTPLNAPPYEEFPDLWVDKTQPEKSDLGFQPSAWRLPSIELMKELHAHGADYHHVDNYGRTVLMAAVSPYNAGSKTLRERLHILEYLLTQGFDVNAKDNLGRTALFYSLFTPYAYFGDYRDDSGLASRILELSDTSVKDNAGNGIWHYGGLAPVAWDFRQHLLEHLTYNDGVNRWGQSPFMFGWGLDVIERTDLLIKDNEGRTPLMYHPRFLELTQRGVDKNAVDKQGNNALHYYFRFYTSSDYFRQDFSEILGADIDLLQANDQGITPFMLVASNPSHDPFFDNYDAAIFRAFVSAYLEQGNDLDIQDLNGNTALHYAVRDGSFARAVSLLQAGADWHLPNKQGQTVVDIMPELLEVVNNLGVRDVVINGRSYNIFSVASSGREDFLALMLEQGVNLNALDAHDQTPLIYATAHNPRVEVVQWLIAQGAELNHQDFDNWTALMHAARSNPNPEVLIALLEAGADPMLKNNYGDQALLIVTNNQNLSAEQKARVTEALAARMTE